MTTEDLARDVNPRHRGAFLKNLADFQTELGRVQAGFVPALEVWRHRKELPEYVFRSMRRVQDLRARGRELGLSFAEMHVAGAVVGRDVLDRLCAAPSSAAFVRAGLIELPRLLARAIDLYLGDNDTIYDLPSRALLEANREELGRVVAWGEAAQRDLAPAAADQAFVDDLAIRAAALSDELRHTTPRTAPPSRHQRRIGRLPLPDAVLPVGFRHLEFGPEPAANGGAAYADRARYRATNFLQEVQATDSCASLLFDAPDMPWDFYLDLSRHMWDEARHSMFGEAKLAEFGCTAAEAGLSTKAYAMRQTLAPHDRYAALTTQEADAFPGKHNGLKDAVAHQDRVSAMAWSYDIADETQHVRFGAKWLPILIEKIGEPRSVEQVKTDACTWRESVLAAVYRPAATALQSQR